MVKHTTAVGGFREQVHRIKIRHLEVDEQMMHSNREKG